MQFKMQLSPHPQGTCYPRFVNQLLLDFCVISYLDCLTAPQPWSQGGMDLVCSAPWALQQQLAGREEGGGAGRERPGFASLSLSSRGTFQKVSSVLKKVANVPNLLQPARQNSANTGGRSWCGQCYSRCCCGNRSFQLGKRWGQLSYLGRIAATPSVAAGIG